MELIDMRNQKFPLKQFGVLSLIAIFSLALTNGVEAREQFWTETSPRGVGMEDDAPVVYGDFHRLAKAMSPAVVNIRTVKRLGTGAPSGPSNSPEFEFYRRFFGFGPNAPGPREVPGLGSGFIITPDGYIVTNYHVIENANEVKVTLADDRELEAEVVGTDPNTDLALLKVEAKNLPVAPLGNSDVLEVGEWVMAIGNPFDFSHTVTAGIVSAKGRREVQPGHRQLYADFIQTDASINPGNSGGPLFNIRGQVIGVNTAIYSRDGTYAGIGFAIPINMAKAVLPALKNTGYVERSWLGVVIQAVDQELASSFGMDKPRGALIAEVNDESPAGKSGIQQGDVIVEFDGHRIEKSSDLPWLASVAGVGRKVDTKVLRDGRERNIKVKMGQYPDEEAPKVARREKPQSGKNTAVLGLRVTEVPAQVWNNYGIKEGVGVLVVDVDHGSPAMRAGIGPRDVIVQVNGKIIGNPSDLEKTVSKLPAKGYIRLLLARGSTRRFVAFRLP